MSLQVFRSGNISFIIEITVEVDLVFSCLIKVVDLPSVFPLTALASLLSVFVPIHRAKTFSAPSVSND